MVRLHTLRSFAASLVVISCLAAAAAAQQTVLLDFSTANCAPCRRMDPIVEQLRAEGYPVRRVDGDRERQLVQRFRVDRYPTFVLVSGGREVHRNVGPMTYEQIRQLLASAGVSAGAQRAPSADRPSRRSPVVPATFAGPSPTSGAAYQVGSDLGAVPEVTIPGASPATSAAATAASAAHGQAFPPVAAMASAAPRPSMPAAAGPDLRLLLSASVRIKVRDPGGSSFGTGTIIDTRQGEALVLTCAHLFRDSSGTAAPVTVELFQPSAGGVVVIEETAGQVVSSDLKNDVALLSIRPTRPVQAARVAGKASAPQVGAATWSVGCDRGDDPTVRSGQVTTIDKYVSPPSLTVTGAPVVGRSGGGLFNERGEVVGVCFGAYEPDNEGFYAKLSSIHAQLDDLGLAGLYGGALPASLATTAPPVASPQNSAPPAGVPVAVAAPEAGLVPVAAPPASPPVFRGQDVGTTTPPLARLSSSERAALEELSRRAAESEVVCVIRPKEAGGRSEVITLDKVSPAFLRALQAMRGGATPR